jgi:hypothetical protein
MTAVIFLSLFASFALAMIVWGLICTARAHRARMWPFVMGIVKTSNVAIYDEACGARVKYEYSIEGQHYSSDRIAFGYAASGSRADAESICKKLEPGHAVRVYYDPHDSANSVLAYASGGTRILTMVGGLFFVMSCGFMLLTVVSQRMTTNDITERVVVIETRTFVPVTDANTSDDRNAAR